MKTSQDSYTITIKQIVRFQERMHLEKFQVDNNFLTLHNFMIIKYLEEHEYQTKGVTQVLTRDKLCINKIEIG